MRACLQHNRGLIYFLHMRKSGGTCLQSMLKRRLQLASHLHRSQLQLQMQSRELQQHQPLPSKSSTLDPQEGQDRGLAIACQALALFGKDTTLRMHFPALVPLNRRPGRQTTAFLARHTCGDSVGRKFGAYPPAVRLQRFRTDTSRNLGFFWNE